MNFKNLTPFLIVFLGIFACAQDKNPVNLNHSYEIVVSDLTNPWGFVFLPDQSFLITEKDGRLIHFKNGSKTEIKNLPNTFVNGQGGLMDIQLHPDYKNNGWIYLTLSSAEGNRKGSHTALFRGKIKNNQFIDKQLLYKATPNTRAGQHFGSRIIFDNNGYIYFSIGERGERDINPQDITRDGGKIYRLHDDGRIPTDNPFYNSPNAKKAIYSFGHRNPQGMVIHPETGEIWSHEHGPKGGDEINIIKAGKNYGWPVVTYGKNYSGTKITDKTEAEGMESPVHYWDPSIAPCGMEFISSDIYPNWKGNLLVGSLKFQYLNNCYIKNNQVIKEERLLDGLGRLRSIKLGPDGYIYAGIENLGIVKIIPKKI
jgi:glucose/arabinose dehydrogenase